MVQRRSSLPNKAVITMSGVLKGVIVIWLTSLIDDFGDASSFDNNWSQIFICRLEFLHDIQVIAKPSQKTM